MKKIYVYDGKVPMGYGFDIKFGKIGKIAERRIEDAITDAQFEYRSELMTEIANTLSELGLVYIDKREIISSIVESFLEEHVSIEGCYLDKIEVEILFDEILEKVFDVKLEDESDLDCDECTNGRSYNNADPTSGQWVECRKCKGTGRLTPEQLEGELSHV